MVIKNNRSKTIIFTLMTLTIIIIVLIVAGEIVARKIYGDGMLSMIDPQVHHTPRPYINIERTWGTGKTSHYITNSLGWRDKIPDNKIEKINKTQKRIVFIGDSFTEGMGFNQKDTISGVAETLLLKENINVEALNGGTASYSPLVEYTRIRQFIKDGYKTDIIVLLPDLADVHDEVWYRSFFKFDDKGEPIEIDHIMYKPVVNFILNNSTLARIIKKDAYNKFKDWYLEFFAKDNIKKSSLEELEAKQGIVNRSTAKNEPKIISVNDLLGASPSQSTWIRCNYWRHQPSINGWVKEITPFMLSNVKRIKKICDENNIKLVVVIYPWTFHFTATEPTLNIYENTFVSFCKDNNIKLINLIPIFRAVGGSNWQDLYIKGDIHFTENGNKLAGTTIGKELISEVRKITK